MSGICFMLKAQNAEVHDSVVDPAVKHSSIGYPASPEDVGACLS